MNNRPNCPNCGAPIKGAICEYCGTVLYDHVNIDKFSSNKLRINTGGKLLVVDADCENVEFDVKENSMTYWADNKPYEILTTTDLYIDVRFHVKPDKKGILYSIIKQEAKKSE